MPGSGTSRSCHCLPASQHCRNAPGITFKCLTISQINTQFYASLRYVSTRHPLSAPIDPFNLPPPQSANPASSPHAIANGGTSTQSQSQSQPQSLQSPPTASQTPQSLLSQAQLQSQTQSDASSQAQNPQIWSSQTTNPLITPPPLPRFTPFTDPLRNPLDPTGAKEAARPSKPGREDKDKDRDKEESTSVSPSHQPLAIPDFQAAVRELAQDLVAKQKQIEALLRRLPDDAGEGVERERQESRMRELEGEMGVLKGQVEGARRKREEMVGRVDGIMGLWANRFV